MASSTALDRGASFIDKTNQPKTEALAKESWVRPPGNRRAEVAGSPDGSPVGSGAASLDVRAGGGRVQWKGGFSGKVGGSTVSRWCLSKQRAFQARGGRSVTPDAGERQMNRTESCRRLAAQLTRMGTKRGMGMNVVSQEELKSFRSPQG